MSIEPQPPEAPHGCMFLAWVIVLFSAASLVGIVLQKLFPFLFP